MSRLALIGNPNIGKTSLFNTLTNSYEYVGNWSGVTVEKKVGQVKKLQKEIIDLPGVYTLNPISRDESVVTSFLLEDQVDGILNIIDASNFERNMQLTVDILEFSKPVFICLNMIDVAKKKGISIDVEKLQSSLGVHVIPISARTGKGVEGIYAAIQAFDHTQQRFTLTYDDQIEEGISKIEALLQHIPEEQRRWCTIQFLLGNDAVDAYLKEKEYFEQLAAMRDALEKQIGESLNKAISKKRDLYISNIYSEVIIQEKSEIQWTEKVDKILTHPILGIPIFLALMFLMFQATFAWIGTPLSDYLDGLVGGPLTDTVTQGLEAIGAAPFIINLICDGIIAGVGGVLVFIPQIFVLFFFISLLEDSGYMARIAVVMDRIMEFFGLNGKAFIPMIVSFGCNVPGVMAARTIEQPRERLLTILVAPFMSCSARLPVYALFGAAFFTAHQSLVVFSLYVMGIVVALIVTKLLSMTILKNETSVFIVELPAYHVPQLKTLWRSTWEKGKGFFRKAGTIIFAGSVIIWLLSYLGPHGANVNMDDSFLAIIGGAFGVLFIPLGFGTWQAGASLIAGFLAKEVIVSTMAIIYGVSEGVLSSTMSTHFTALSAYTFLAFVLLYMPCLATVGAIKRETQSVKWTLFATIYPFVVAYLIALMIYGIGNLLM